MWIKSARMIWTALLAACLFYPATSTAQTEQASVADEQRQSPAPVATSVSPAYHLGIGDKLRVIVFGVDTLGGEFVVGSTGSVSLPLIGELKAQGLTVSELQDKIMATLADGYVKQPRVSVEVLNYRPFYILGEVNKPGEYPYVNGLSVLNAVAQAEGFTYRANKRQVRIKHPLEDGDRKIPLTSDTQIGPGDTIIIQERWF